MRMAAQEMQSLLAVDAATAAEAGAGASAATAAPICRISRAGFLDHIDACVRYLAAWLGGATDPAGKGAPPAAECSRIQLWQWLHGGEAALDDGTPIDFALFDSALQRVGERLPRRGLPGQDKLMQAAWLLAELTHARTFAEIPASSRAP